MSVISSGTELNRSRGYKTAGETAKSLPGCKYSVRRGNPPFEKFVRYRCVATYIADK